MIQSGDPLTKDLEKKELWGTGRADNTIPDEFPETYDHSNLRGTISMANSGPDTGSIQFFINLKNNVLLDDKHPVFGEVTEGMDVVDAIANVEVEESQFGEKSRPVEEVRILRAYLG
jgi:peptidylprolyl isomerase